jgi:hypothetical protein
VSISETRRLTTLHGFIYMLVFGTFSINRSGLCPRSTFPIAVDDKNDGLSPQTAIYSLKRAKKLQGGRMTTAGTSGREHGSESKRSFRKEKEERLARR